MPPPHVSDLWRGRLTIRDRFWRFLGLNRAGRRPTTVKLDLQCLESRDLPNNLLASGLFSDFTPADATLVATATETTFDAPADATFLLSGRTTAAPVADATLDAPPLRYQAPDSTALALAGNAPAPPAAPLTPADLLFQSALADPSAGAFNYAVFSDPLQAAPPPPASPTPAPEAPAAPHQAAATQASLPAFPSGSSPAPVTGTAPTPAVAGGGDAAFAASPSLVLAPAAPLASTSTFLFSSVNPSAPGQAVTFTAKVNSPSGGTPTGTVNFMDGATSLGTATLTNAQATFTTSSLTVGNHSITAVYSGDAAYAGSTSSALTQTVQLVSTSTFLFSSVNPSAPGQAVAFTAKVNSPSGGTPTGTVNFMDGAASLGTATLTNAQATFTTSSLTVGSHSITGVYSGDATFAGSTSSVLTQTVQLTPTSTSLSSSVNPSVSGQAVTFTANVSGSGGTPTGTVTFNDGTTSLGTATLAGAQASFTTSSLTVGNHSITAVYSGDATFAGSTSTALTQTVNQPALGTIWTVINNLDNGIGVLAARTGDLRFCLTNAGNGDTIDFAIPGVGVQTINMASALPSITHGVIIDGFSQGGGLASGVLVQVNGGGLTADGLDVNAGGATIKGLSIYNFLGNGVVLNNPVGSAGDTISGCLIGTDANGDANVGNGTGVLVEGGNDTIGDSTGAATTVISGNHQDGIDVSGANATGDLITNAWVGVVLTGLVALGNGGDGAGVTGGATGATFKDDVFSNDAGSGILLDDASNSVIGCKIGVAKDGTTAAPNTNGIYLSGSAASNTIGSSAAGGRNIISGNRRNGILLTGANVTQNTVTGNYIGLDKNGNVVGNGWNGVNFLNGAHDNTIGGTTAGSVNVISGNGQSGVKIDGSTGGAHDNTVAGDYIGTNAAGTAAVDSNGAATGNSEYGVLITNSNHNFVGAPAPAQPPDTTVTVISGNTRSGILLDTAQTNLIQNCYIGTDVGGTLRVGNLQGGISVGVGSSNNTIGGLQDSARNVISANGDNHPAGNGAWGISLGIVQYTVGPLVNTNQNLIQGNYIGTDFKGLNPLGNDGDGVYFSNSNTTNNTIGGTAIAAMNVISNNGGYGIDFAGATGNSADYDYIGVNLNGTDPVGNLKNTGGAFSGQAGNNIGTHNKTQ